MGAISTHTKGHSIKLTVFGCRGSVPFSRRSLYGDNTSCMLITASCSSSPGHEEEHLILDAGSGLYGLDLHWKASGRNAATPVHVLLSHLHFDHTIGLINFSNIYSDIGDVNIYTCSRDGRPLKEQVLSVFRPPYWPLDLSAMPSVKFKELMVEARFNLGSFDITPFVANHPDNTTAYKIKAMGKTIVYLLDFEMAALSDDEHAKLLSYCRNADLIVFDASYNDEDCKRRKGWGHSTVAQGKELLAHSCAKRMIFSHFSQEYEDEELDAWAVGLDSRFVMARDGLEIIID